MPYVSQKQRAYLKAFKPEVAAKFDKHSPPPRKRRRRRRGALSKPRA